MMFGTGIHFESLDIQEANVDSYIERFVHLCRAHKVNDDQKLSLLFSVMGSNAHEREMLKNPCLPEALDIFSLSQVKNNLLPLFSSRYSDIVELVLVLLQFVKAVMIVLQLVSNLEQQIMRCDYLEYSNVMLRHQFLKLTFYKAVELPNCGTS